MDFLVATVKESNADHILVEGEAKIGYRFSTLAEDEYMANEQYKLFIYEDLKIENNSIVVNRFAFLDPHVRELFKFLIGLKGIGPKGAKNIILSVGGSKKLVDALYGEELEKIIPVNKKYAEALIQAIAKSKNKEFIANLASRICRKNIRAEVLWILLQMEYERGKCLRAIDEVNAQLMEQGNALGIESLKVEEAVKECLSHLFSH